MTEREELEMWKKMYMRLLRGTVEAIDILIQSERDCEELYVSADHTHKEYNLETEAASKIKWQFCEVMGEPQRQGYLIIPRASDG